MPASLSFLTSNRFWALVAFVVVMVLGDNGVLTPDTVTYLQTLLGGFVGIRTVDRATEKLGGK